jgi:hypothetical protein
MTNTPASKVVPHRGKRETLGDRVFLYLNLQFLKQAALLSVWKSIKSKDEGLNITTCNVYLMPAKV